jgi:hypothetical protein
MKIYILPVEDEYYLLPKISPFCAHSFGYNCELDFHNYIQHYPELTKNPDEADWHYLPLYWSYWQLSHNYGKDGREEMSEYLKKIVIDPKKTFTVSEADWEPNFGVEMKVFSGNTKDNGWTPIPILTLPHKIPDVLPDKKYHASFVGNTGAWPVRVRMVELLKDDPVVNIVRSKKGEDLFVNSILESYTTLCPRGSALGSYRFYESMQLGVAPVMISDYDFRPFGDKIDWGACSYFVDDVEKLPQLFHSISKEEAVEKGKIAQQVWNGLYNQGWCEYVMQYL